MVQIDEQQTEAQGSAFGGIKKLVELAVKKPAIERLGQRIEYRLLAPALRLGLGLAGALLRFLVFQACRHAHADQFVAGANQCRPKALGLADIHWQEGGEIGSLLSKG